LDQLIKTALGHPIEVGRVHRSAECARVAEAGVVDGGERTFGTPSGGFTGAQR